MIYYLLIRYCPPGHPVPTKYNVGIIFRRKINNDTALGMLGHQSGPVSLFFSGLASWAAGIIIFSAGTRPGAWIYFSTMAVILFFAASVRRGNAVSS